MTTADLLRRAGPDTWRAFHAHWGWTTPRVLAVQPALTVPPLLLAFHETVGHVQTNLLTPLLRLRANDGFVCIYDEAQGVFNWALREVDLGEDDPPVWGPYNEPEAEWTLQAPTLSLFLAQVLVLDATVQGMFEVGFYTPAEVSSTEAQRVLAPMERLPWPSWSWATQCGFYAGDGAVAIVFGEGDDWCLVHVGGRTERTSNRSACWRRGTTGPGTLRDEPVSK